MGVALFLGEGGQVAYGICSLIRSSASSVSQAFATVRLVLRGLTIGAHHTHGRHTFVIISAILWVRSIIEPSSKR